MKVQKLSKNTFYALLVLYLKEKVAISRYWPEVLVNKHFKLIGYCLLAPSSPVAADVPVSVVEQAA